ncbi:hypothetical protein V6N13_026608 [Hibiscus sabdariffa]|uniref:Uncharacterized protein n=1 Tax=Hibiscus sabdariffa TaxID=183260 RepID=A0ABR2PEW7_9ROSI
MDVSPFNIDGRDLLNARIDHGGNFTPTQGATPASTKTPTLPWRNDLSTNPRSYSCINKDTYNLLEKWFPCQAKESLQHRQRHLHSLGEMICLLEQNSPHSLMVAGRWVVSNLPTHIVSSIHYRHK